MTFGFIPLLSPVVNCHSRCHGGALQVRVAMCSFGLRELRSSSPLANVAFLRTLTHKKNILSLRRNIFSFISFLFNMCLLRTDSLVYHQDRSRTKFKKLTHNLVVLCKSLSRGLTVLLGHGDPILDKSSEKFHDTLFFTIVVQQTLTKPISHKVTSEF